MSIRQCGVRLVNDLDAVIHASLLSALIFLITFLEIAFLLILYHYIYLHADSEHSVSTFFKSSFEFIYKLYCSTNLYNYIEIIVLLHLSGYEEECTLNFLHICK